MALNHDSSFQNAQLPKYVHNEARRSHEPALPEPNQDAAQQDQDLNERLELSFPFFNERAFQTPAQIERLQAFIKKFQEAKRREVLDDRPYPSHLALEFSAIDLIQPEWDGVIGELQACGKNPSDHDISLNADVFNPNSKDG